MKGQITYIDERRFAIQYNTDELDNMSPDKIVLWNEYIEVNDEMKVLRKRIKKSTLPYLIEGDKGTGKTLMVRTLAKELGYGYVEIKCGDNINDRQLFGSPQLEGDTSYWNAGKLAVAFKGLKIYKKVLVFFDGLEFLSTEVQLQLLSLFDKRKSIEVAGQVFNVEDDEKLMIVCTTNPPIYIGTNTLVGQLRSRLVGEVRPTPTSAQYKKILDWKGIPIDMVQSPLLTIVSNTHDLAVKNHITHVLSPRDVEQFIEIYNDTKDIVQCINQSILIKYSDLTEREQIKERCIETFGVKL
tara:strand:- start:1576 stop:2469 length:894 start_codon:yes stop_codon:yes gene_type:complete